MASEGASSGHRVVFLSETHISLPFPPNVRDLGFPPSTSRQKKSMNRFMMLKDC